MKRDMELIRKLLLEVESQSSFPCMINLPDVDYHTSLYHVQLLKDAGFIAGDFVGGSDHIPFMFKGLTWKGCEFLDNARSPEVWSEANKQVESTVGTVSLSVLTAVLIEIAKEKLGLK